MQIYMHLSTPGPQPIVSKPTPFPYTSIIIEVHPSSNTRCAVQLSLPLCVLSRKKSAIDDSMNWTRVRLSSSSLFNLAMKIKEKAGRSIRFTCCASSNPNSPTSVEGERGEKEKRSACTRRWNSWKSPFGRSG